MISPKCEILPHLDNAVGPYGLFGFLADAARAKLAGKTNLPRYSPIVVKLR